jgi:hypothetical protein
LLTELLEKSLYTETGNFTHMPNVISDSVACC